MRVRNLKSSFEFFALGGLLRNAGPRAAAFVFGGCLAVAIAGDASAEPSAPRDAGVAVALSTSQGSADATGRTLESGGFSPEEVAALEAGRSVKRRFLIDRGETTYHAGYSYRLVRASPRKVVAMLRRPGELVKVIPYALSATTVSERDGITRMRISQGKRPVVGRYTVRLEWNLPEHGARFWLDPKETHDVNDVWGVFSAREVADGLTLVSFGFAFDIGGVGSLLERKAQSWGLTTADRIADVLEGN